MSYDPRPFITVTNELFRHPKFTGLPNDRSRLWLLTLWAHCNEFKTDGLVPKHILNSRGAATGNALIAAGWVEATPDPDLFLMHDYLDHQKSRAELEELREQRRENGAEGLHIRWHVKRGIKKPSCEYCR